MGKLSKLRDSDETTLADVIKKITHDLASQAYIKSETFFATLEKLELSVEDLESLKGIVLEGKNRYRKKTTRELESVEFILKRLDEKIKFYGIPVGVRKSVEIITAPKLGRRASRTERAEGRKEKGINQTREHRAKEALTRIPELAQLPTVQEKVQLQVYTLMALPEEEGKRIYGISKYFTKLMGQKYVTKSELMGLKDFFERAAEYLQRFEGKISYEKINNLKNRMKSKVSKCGAKILASDLLPDYEKFMELISVK